jgi:hypothetical protein
VAAVPPLPVVQELTAGPPGGFTLSDTDGDTLMTLTKSHGGEKVSVDVMVNEQVGWVGGEMRLVGAQKGVRNQCAEQRPPPARHAGQRACWQRAELGELSGRGVSRWAGRQNSESGAHTIKLCCRLR